ncbi:MAG: SANT/Myb-like DNA-binding domain-containing protein [Rhodospirillaceae bacterium]
MASAHRGEAASAHRGEAASDAGSGEAGSGAGRSPRPAWTEDDRRQLRLFCAQALSCEEIAERLGRTRRAVEAMILRLGLSQNAPARPWTAEECATILRLHAEGAGWAALAEAIPDRSPIAIYRKLSHLVGPAPFRSAALAPAPARPLPAGRPVRVVRAKPPSPPPAVSASAEAIVRWLRSRDFMVLRLAAGWRVDHRVLDSDADLVAFTNVRRGWLRMPPFILIEGETPSPPVIHHAGKPGRFGGAAFR